MNFELIFDADKVGYRHWKFPAAGMLLVAFQLCIVIYTRKYPAHAGSSWLRKNPAVRQPVFALVILLLWVAIAFIGTFSQYWELRQALRSGDFEIVEGKVTDLMPVAPQGNTREQFTVNGHHYKYSDYLITPGFNNSRSLGGPIRDGLHVRIADVLGNIRAWRYSGESVRK